MYTRAGLFSACVLIVPAMLLALLAAAVLVSRGQLQTTGTLARASRYQSMQPAGPENEIRAIFEFR